MLGLLNRLNLLSNMTLLYQFMGTFQLGDRSEILIEYVSGMNMVRFLTPFSLLSSLSVVIGVSKETNMTKLTLFSQFSADIAENGRTGRRTGCDLTLGVRAGRRPHKTPQPMVGVLALHRVRLRSLV